MPVGRAPIMAPFDPNADANLLVHRLGRVAGQCREMADADVFERVVLHGTSIKSSFHVGGAAHRTPRLSISLGCRKTSHRQVAANVVGNSSVACRAAR